MDEEVVPILRVANAATSVAWYERLGFRKEWEHRFDPDCPAFVSIAYGRARLFLSEHRGDARPDTLVWMHRTWPLSAVTCRPVVPLACH
jgi:hypothetical protein